MTTPINQPFGGSLKASQQSTGHDELGESASTGPEINGELFSKLAGWCADQKTGNDDRSRAMRRAQSALFEIASLLAAEEAAAAELSKPSQ